MAGRKIVDHRTWTDFVSSAWATGENAAIRAPRNTAPMRALLLAIRLSPHSGANYRAPLLLGARRYGKHPQVQGCSPAARRRPISSSTGGRSRTLSIT